MKRKTVCRNLLLRPGQLCSAAVLGMFLICADNLCGQMPNYFGTPASPSSTSQPAATGLNSTEKPATSGLVGTAGKPESGAPASASGTASPTSPKNMGPLYDPSMDNHLKAPETGGEIGLFGRPIGEVEENLRFLGGKNHSYAFGKYSCMTLSVYLVTLYFDRDRKLGGFAVQPRPPYKVIGPDARKFFMDIFVAGGDLSKFETKIAAEKLEIRYAP